MRQITITHYQVHVALMTVKRTLGQRSRSAGDGRRNLVNSIARGPLKGFQPKLTRRLHTMRPQN